jgi:hypothetical protein
MKKLRAGLNSENFATGQLKIVHFISSILKLRAKVKSKFARCFISSLNSVPFARGTTVYSLRVLR